MNNTNTETELKDVEIPEEIKAELAVEPPKEMTREEKRRLERDNKKREIAEKNYWNTMVTRKEACEIAEHMATDIAKRVVSGAFQAIHTSLRSLLVHTTALEKTLIDQKGLINKEEFDKTLEDLVTQAMDEAKKAREKMQEGQQSQEKSEGVVEDGNKAEECGCDKTHTHDNDQDRVEEKGN